MDFNKVIRFLSWNEIPPEFISSVLSMIIVIILAIVIRIKLKHYDPLKKTNGFLSIVEEIINFTDKKVTELMGNSFEGFGGYIVALGAYIIIGFIIGMIGIPNFFQPESEQFLIALPNPFTNIAMPLSIALCTFCLTHFEAIRCRHLGYFRRYVEPVFVFLPVNLISMWSSLLSLTLRLFGNALAGYCIITIIYVGIGTILPPSGSLTGLVLTPLLAPIAHLYFDLFDGAIQLIVFTMLTMINISQEFISKDDLALEKEERINRKLEKKERKQRKISLKKAN